MLATASRVVLIDCYVTGGQGYCKPYMFGCTQWTQPTPAVTARSGCTIVVKGSTLIGGKGAYSSCFPCNPKPAAGLIADATTKIVRDAGTSFSISGGQTSVQGVFDLQASGATPGNPIPITIRSATPVPYAVFANHGMRPEGAPIAVWIDVTAPILLYGDFVNGSRTVHVTPPSCCTDRIARHGPRWRLRVEVGFPGSATAHASGHVSRRVRACGEEPGPDRSGVHPRGKPDSDLTSLKPPLLL